MIRALSSAIALGVLTAGAISPAFAQETRAVGYSDLNLATPAGEAALRHRVAVAVKQVCGDPDYRDLQALGQMRQCRKITGATAGNQVAFVIDHAQQTALATGSTNQVASR